MQKQEALELMRKNSIYSIYVKRTIDLLLASFLLVVLSPLLLIVSILVRTKLGSPVFFKQDRPGLNEKIFTMYKFRTMTNEKDSHGELLPNNIRLTKFGKLLRSTSLDEIPELINIVRGEMSFIGPRPLLVEYLPLYNNEQRRRHEVRPGLSGLAQVKGRNNLTWAEKFEYDLTYVKNVSFILDLKIFGSTVLKVFKREGVNKSDNVTMDKFRGSEAGERSNNG